MVDHVAIREKMSSLLGDILDEDDLDLKDDTVAEDVDGWDSINHVKLVIELEKFYKIRLDPEEISAPENVGKFVDLISEHIKAGS